MGYRSSVGICFKRESDEAPAIPLLVTLAKMKEMLSTDYFDKSWGVSSVGWNDNDFVFYVEDVKWYDGYEDVQAMDRFFEFVESMNIDDDGNGRDWYSGTFVRIGEETADIEEKSFGPSPWDLLYVTRGMEFDQSLLGKRKGASDE